jgi:hypothetical protein
VAVAVPLQASNATASLTYALPTITSVVAGQGRPIVGNFTVEVLGQVG